MYRRSKTKKVVDTITFPFRAFVANESDIWGLSSLRTERFDYVAKQACGYTLDIGCGRNNRFIKEFLDNNGIGIDVFKYSGLTDENIVEDMTKLPFENNIFDTVTFIANINHVPKRDRLQELNEAYRILKSGGNIIITMGVPWAEILTHKVVWLSDRFFKTNIDVDNERGMDEDEEYFLRPKEIFNLLQSSGFKNITTKSFGTQWFLNKMYIGWK